MVAPITLTKSTGGKVSNVGRDVIVGFVAGGSRVVQESPTDLVMPLASTVWRHERVDSP